MEDSDPTMGYAGRSAFARAAPMLLRHLPWSAPRRHHHKNLTGRTKRFGHLCSLRHATFAAGIVVLALFLWLQPKSMCLRVAGMRVKACDGCFVELNESIRPTKAAKIHILGNLRPAVDVATLDCTTAHSDVRTHDTIIVRYTKTHERPRKARLIGYIRLLEGQRLEILVRELSAVRDYYIIDSPLASDPDKNARAVDRPASFTMLLATALSQRYKYTELYVHGAAMSNAMIQGASVPFFGKRFFYLYADDLVEVVRKCDPIVIAARAAGTTYFITSETRGQPTSNVQSFMRTSSKPVGICRPKTTLKNFAASTCDIGSLVMSDHFFERKGTSDLIMHVTREYGTATFGGLGASVTMLATSTAHLSRNHTMMVILPAYPFLLQRHSFKMAGVALTSEGSLFGKVLLHKDARGTLLVALQLPDSIAFQAQNIASIYSVGLEKKSHLCFNAFAAIAASAVSEFYHSVIMHVHGSINGLIPALMRLDEPRASSKSNVRVVYTIHDLSSEFDSGVPRGVIDLANAPADVLCPYVRNGMCMLSPIAVRDADAVTGVSQGLINEMFSSDCDACMMMKQRDRNVTFGIPWTADLHERNAEALLRRKQQAKRAVCKALAGRHRAHACASLPMIGFVGRFESLKGAGVVLSLLKQCSNPNVLEKYSIAIVGLHNLQQVSRDIESAMAKAKAQDSCIIVSATTRDEQAKFGDIIRHAIDVQIAPSHSEGFGLVLVEAINAGAYPIASSNAGFSDVIPEALSARALEDGLTVPHIKSAFGSTRVLARHAIAASVIASLLTTGPDAIYAKWAAGQRRRASVKNQKTLIDDKDRAKLQICKRIVAKGPATDLGACIRAPMIAVEASILQDKSELRSVLMSYCSSHLPFNVISLGGNWRAARSMWPCMILSNFEAQVSQRTALLASDACIASPNSSALEDRARQAGSCPVSAWRDSYHHQQLPLANSGMTLHSKHYADYVQASIASATIIGSMSAQERLKMLQNQMTDMHRRLGSWNSRQGPAGRYLQLYESLNESIDS